MRLLKALVYVPMITAVLMWFVFTVHVDTFVPAHRQPCPIYRQPRVTKYADDWLPAGAKVRIVERRDGWVRVAERGWVPTTCKTWSMKPSSN